MKCYDAHDNGMEDDKKTTNFSDGRSSESNRVSFSFLAAAIFTSDRTKRAHRTAFPKGLVMQQDQPFNLSIF